MNASAAETPRRRRPSRARIETADEPRRARAWSSLRAWSARRLRSSSLRLRLVLAVVALMALVVGLLSVGTGVVLRGYLVRSLDRELSATMERAVQGLNAVAGLAPGYAIGVPGQTEGTLAAFIAGGQLQQSSILSRSGQPTALTAENRLALPAAINGRPIGVTFDATVGSLGDYRFTSVSFDSGLFILLVGVPTSSVDGVMGQYSWLAAIVGAGVLLVAGLGALLIGTRLQRTTSRLERALAAREASEGRLRRFAADASHELRTPLAAIRGYAELTRRSGARLPEDVAHSLDRIESESIRMTGLVEDLLLLARLDEHQPLAAEPVELSGLVALAVGDIQVSAPDHDWSVAAPAPVEVRGDAMRLHQAVANLLSNAARHTPAGTRIVARVRAEAGAAVVEVEDDGPGIPASLVPDLFGRFVRGDAARTRLAGGGPAGSSTGLGLAIVLAIASAHGGSATAESEPGRTIFRIRIPLSA